MSVPVPRRVLICLCLGLITLSSANREAAGTPPGWTNDEAIYLGDFGATLPALASTPEGRLMVLWVDERGLDREVYYKLRAGGEWSPDSALTGG